MDPMVVRIACAVLALVAGVLIFKRRRSRNEEQ
jgi:hypothetical protein